MSDTSTTTPPDRSTAVDDRVGARPRGTKRRWLVVAAVLGAVLVVGAASLAWLDGGGDGDDAPRADQAPTTTVAPSTAPTAGPGTQDAGTAVPPADQPDATGVLAPFFSAAATMDDQLHAAADAINGAGPPWATVTDGVAGSVRAADPAVVARTVPAGLPDDLLRAVILVYSDLASRRAAMQSFALAGTPYETSDALLAELGNGHAAATRFDSDLAAAQSLARSAPSVTVAPPDSREAAEVLLLVQYVDGSNAGCDSRGGAVVTELPVITWESDNGGTIGSPPAGIHFEATLGPDGYQVEILAC